MEVFDTPWMDDSEILLILKHLYYTDTMLEWGSGGSTLYFPYFVKKYYSIEHDTEWSKKIELKKPQNVEFHHVPWDSPRTIPTQFEQFETYVHYIKKLGIKYLINCGAGIFRKKIIEIPGLVILNAHAGKLPEYKNMNVVEWAICNEDKVFGTVHQIDKGIDTGPVWLEEEIDLSQQKTLIEAREHSFDCAIRMVGKAVLMNEQGKITPQLHDIKEGKKWYRMHSFYQNKVENLLKD